MISTPEYDLVIQPLRADHADRYRRASREDPMARTKRSTESIPDPHIIIKREAGADLRPGSGSESVPEGAQGQTDGSENTHIDELNDEEEGEPFCGLDTSKLS